MQVINQNISPGTLMLFYSLVGYILGPVSKLISSNQTIQDALIAADRLFQIMDLEREQDDANKIVITPDMAGDISFKNLSFRYGFRKQIFTELNLTIKKGQTTAIVGESGSGKTTIISLIQQLYPVQSGNVYIGDFNLAQIGNESLRRLIGSVSQHIELFAGSIAENIALGDFEPDMKRVIMLCELLGIREFIEQLPAAYMTYIGEHGVSLSGGERQRIAIARALYKNPEILIVDEGTSSLDSIAEKHLKQALKSFSDAGKTVIIIAHRLSTVIDSDTIIVIDKGTVAETGNHEQLVVKGGLYSRLWKEQYNLL